MNQQTYTLPEDLAASVRTAVDDWRSHDKVQRLWRRDASLWTGTDEANWLGWLDVVDEQIAQRQSLLQFAKDVKAEGFAHALLLGMGGSSLCPEVLKMTFGKIAGWPELHVLDSTDPAQIKAIEKKIDVARTLFIVSSKSGGTLEPNIFKQYFFARAKEAVGADKVGSRFITVTDPGSKMQQVAEKDRFRRIFPGIPSIGGRYSALSNFGVVPAAVMGLDVVRFLDRTHEMVKACGASVPAQDNPGATLGIILGLAAKSGRDKVTVVASPAIHDLGAWLEQLLAESTGKEGTGIIPVDREPLGKPPIYGKDRVFAYLRLTTGPDAHQDATVTELEKAGQPVIRISLDDIYDLGQEFFRWEIATAVAGSIIGINAFNQPDVEASKVVTRQLTSEFEKTGSLPAEQPMFQESGLKLFTDAKNAQALAASLGADKSLTGYLRAHLNRIKPGDYFASLAYIQMNDAHEKQMESLRLSVREAKHVATCVGFGPRFLHSTGQAYKGGPNSGVFLQITCDDSVDLPVPEQKYTFGVVKAAQARGDFQVLAERGRRALRVHLAADLESGLAKLVASVKSALG